MVDREIILFENAGLENMKRGGLQRIPARNILPPNLLSLFMSFQLLPKKVKDTSEDTAKKKAPTINLVSA